MKDVTARIRPINTAEELAELCELRAQVFFGEDILRRNPTTSLTDELDQAPSTTNLVVVTSADRIVGGVRVTLPDGDLVPANTSYFDFRDLLPAAGRTASCGSMLCIHKDFRHTHLASLLTRSAMYVSLRGGATHLCASVRPVMARFFGRLGWVQVADEFDHPIELVPVVPMFVDLYETCSEEHLEQVLSPRVEVDAIREVVQATSA